MRNFVIAALLIASCSAANAQNCVDYDMYDAERTYPGARLIVHYIADIQQEDRFNSNGVSLSTAEEVMVQDRANVNKFGFGSDLETPDEFFVDPEKRAILKTAQYITYCGTDLTDLKRRILQGNVPGLLDVMLFKISISERYVLFMNAVG